MLTLAMTSKPQMSSQPIRLGLLTKGWDEPCLGKVLIHQCKYGVILFLELGEKHRICFWDNI